MNFEEQVVTGAELTHIKKLRTQRYITKTFPKAETEDMIAQGWELNRELKKFVSLKKLKPIDEQFENKVWVTFANLGFTQMNKDRNLKIQYDPKDPSSSKQIDVLAVDSETVIIVECKTSDTIKKVSFKEEIEAWRGIKFGLSNFIKSKYPEHKIKFIFATENCYLSQPDADRLKAIGFLHFDEKI